MDMSQTSLPRMSALVAVVAGFGLADAASAAIQLSVAATPKPDGLAYQQTADDPCIFGNSDCKSPANWDFSDTPTGNTAYNNNLWSYSDDKAVADKDKSGNVFTDQNWTGKVGKDTFTFYTSTQLFDVLGCDAKSLTCGFFVGFDNNRASDPQILNGFDIWECANTKAEGAANIASSCTLLATLDKSFVGFSMTSNFGTGWSDYKFYDPLNNLAFTAGKFYAFNLKYISNDGPDSAFLIRAGSNPDVPPDEVPLPGTIALLGVGALALASVQRLLPFSQRRRGRQQPEGLSRP